jgi:hypothetical protein
VAISDLLGYPPPPPAPHIFAVALKLELGVIVQVPAVLNINGPFVSKFQVDNPETAGLIVNDLVTAGTTPNTPRLVPNIIPGII